jgi:branched-chain amino acid transport system ATP-binding protein
MSPQEIVFAMSVIEKIRAQGITILLVEHNMKIRSLCDRMVVINFGTKIADGPMDEVRQNQDVINAYFGRDDAA